MASSCTLIGPIVGAAGSGSVRIVLAAPGRFLPRLRCRLEAEQGQARELEVEKQGGGLQVFVFPFAELEPGAWYRYSFTCGAGPLDLQGLRPEDCRFRAPGPFADDDSFLLASCHRPDAKLPEGGGEQRAWAPWRKLGALLEADEGVRLLVLGGDQLYNDEIERKHLPRVHEARLPQIERDLIASYLGHWSHPDYRRALARVPSVAMWDDHDITDGWGSRPEQFHGEQIKPDWRRYFEAARRAAAAYQFARNPPPLLTEGEAPFTTALDLGDDRLLLLDLRSERNAAKKQLWTRAHERAALAAMSAAPGRLFVLSPVAAFRTNPDEDRRLGRLTRLLFRATRWWEIRRRLRRGWPLVLFSALLAGLASPAGTLPFFWLLLGGWTLMGLIPEILLRVPFLPQLTDDLDDGLTSEANRGSLQRLLAALLEKRKGSPVVLLGGDVHLQGLAELVDARDGEPRTIPQVVSSPITNRPMEKVAAGFTTTTSPIHPDENEPRLFARNVAWFSKRGFAQLRPSAFAEGAAGPAVRFHLEGHEPPLAFPASFLGD